MISSRSVRIDFLKAIAIIAVIFYHIGIQTYGYLGVDIFFVVGGFFLGKSLAKQHENGNYSYFSFLYQRILRLWPLLLIAGAVVIVLGAVFMLPDDYENLAQSVVATNFFANNILAAITTKNYWDVVNDFKPLMHTWYVGVLVQSYVVFALAPVIVKPFVKRYKNSLFIAFGIITIASLALYQLPVMEAHEKFYYFPARLFELGLGCMLATLPERAWQSILRILTKKRAMFLQILLFISIGLLISLPIDFVSAASRLLLVNILAGLLIIAISADTQDWDIPGIAQLSFLGKASFSFFVWHQIIIAFVKYAWSAELDVSHILICLLLTAVCAILSYFFVEKKTDAYIRNQSKKRICLVLLAVVCVLTTGISLLIFVNAGYVRDVPELNVYSGNLSSGMHATYCDRVRAYDKEFSTTDKIKVLVLGNSFARDFSNVLLEGPYADGIELSYTTDVSLAGADRVEAADVIFYVIHGNAFTELPQQLLSSDVVDKVYVVGNKNFGANNGNIYNRRYREDYYESSITLTEDYFKQNNSLKQKYGEKYIDLITPVQKADGTIRVFTDDHKFISQDCRHFTQSGAQYYARLLDLDDVLCK